MTAPRRWREESGAVLPMALLLVVGVGALATSILVLARGEALLATGDLRYLAERIQAERLLLAAVADPSEPGPHPAGHTRVHPLGKGFELVRVGREGADPRRPGVWGVRWRMDPDSVGRRLPTVEAEAIEGPERPPAWGGEGCFAEGAGGEGGSGVVRVVLRAPPPTDPAPANPPIPPPPGLGVLGVARLLELPTTDLPGSGSPLQGAGGLLRAPSGADYRTGEAEGVLVAEGDLLLGGEVRVRGVVLVAGDLRLGGAARIEGSVLVGGRLTVEEEAVILGCPALVVETLRRPELEGPHPVPGGWLLGRF